METVRLTVRATRRVASTLDPDTMRLVFGLSVSAAVLFPTAAMWFWFGALMGVRIGMNALKLELLPLACKVAASQGLGPAYGMMVWPALWWSTGCAVGEILPFLVARAGFSGALPCPGLIKRHTWLFVFLTACVNMNFDVCGVLAGSLDTSFWTFFSATWCGKALTKILCLQVPLLLHLCSCSVHDPALQRLVDYLLFAEFWASVANELALLACVAVGCVRNECRRNESAAVAAARK
jgi:hypothetical protein